MGRVHRTNCKEGGKVRDIYDSHDLAETERAAEKRGYLKAKEEGVLLEITIKKLLAFLELFDKTDDDIKKLDIPIGKDTLRVRK